MKAYLKTRTEGKSETRPDFNIPTMTSYLCSYFQVQFGHAGSCANSDMETATAKNQAFKQAGAHVPETFDSLDDVIK